MTRIVRFTLFIIHFSFFISPVGAQNHPKTLLLWEQQRPRYSNGITGDNPCIDVYLPSFEVRGCGAGLPCVLICPGGGYRMLAPYHEGHQWAPWFFGQGMAVAVLTSRLPCGNKRVPLEDAEQAMRLIRRNAEAWNIDPARVGVMGFSAGGHLASTLATHAAADARPDFQILFYPVITMQPELTHRGSHDHLLGKNATKADEELLSNELHVKPTTAPAILIMVDDDRSVKHRNGLSYYEALKRQGIAASLHIYPNGGHGFGFDTEFPYHDAMLRDLGDWLRHTVTGR